MAPGDRGWGPHRDSAEHARDDHGELTRVTIWVPLTDATKSAASAIVRA